MPETQQSDPMRTFVLFLICLAIAGSIIAGAHYIAVDRPAQDAAVPAPAPANCCPCEASPTVRNGPLCCTCGNP